MRLGDLDALKKAIDDYAEKRQDTLLWQSDIEELIDNAPTVSIDWGIDDGDRTVYARPQGEWIKAQGEWETDTAYKICFMCSECKTHFEFPFNFCPNCGAQMVKGGAE